MILYTFEYIIYYRVVVAVQRGQTRDTINTCHTTDTRYQYVYIS